MPCEGCGVQFTVLRRRKVCADCGRHFCSGCVLRSPPPQSPRSPSNPSSPNEHSVFSLGGGGGSVCGPCKVLAARPLARPQLDQLRVRDLQCYLQRQRVSTAGCVEKEDLVNLVIAHVNSGNFIRRPPTRPQSDLTRVLAGIKGFTTNFINSAFDIDSHGSEKSNKNRNYNNSSPNFSHTGGTSSTSQQNATSPKPTTSSSGSNFNQRPVNLEPRNSPSVSQTENNAPVQPPRCIVTDTSIESDSHDVDMGLTDTHDCLEIEDDPDDPDWEIVTPPAEPLPQDSDILLLDNDTPLRNSGRAASDLDLPTRTADTSGDTSSLKNISLTSKISSSRINLNDLTELSQIEGLNVKQLKELLILNRVDFKGCCERKELLERAERLWRESTKSREDLESTGTEELCKICMDAPMECVMLECGHIATCVQCGKRLNECPICRQYVVRVVRFFRS